MNPYILSGPTQIGISGGRSSGYMGEKIMEAHDGKLPENAHMLFNNTGKEAPETLRFLIKLRDKWNVEMPCLEFCGEYPTGLNWRIVRLEDAAMNSEPFDAYLKYYDDFRRLEPNREEKDRVPILPNRVNRSCSDRMKIKAAAWYMRSLGYKRWDAIIGIRKDEPNRYRRMLTQNEKGSDRWENQMPMYIDGVTKEQVNAYWKAQPFDLEIDSDFGNCDLCFQKHPNKIYRALMKNPSAADWWIAHEERTGQRFALDRPSYKVMKWEAIQMLKQVPMFPETEEEEQSADCFCG